MSKKFLLALLLIVTTLFLDATELRRDGWNLISVCQDMNRTEIDMTGIEEIQSQDGKSIYTGEWESYSNLDRLQAGYGYWVKGTTGITFDSGESRSILEQPLLRDGWNLMASCEDIPSLDINLTEWNITEIQSQDGKSIYSGDWADYSNLDSLENGYGYWVKGNTGTPWVSKRGVSIPTGFDYQTINNSGEIIETNFEDLTIRLFVDYNETADAQANHTGIVVRINGQDTPLMQIQDTYRGHNIVVGIYNMDGELIGVSDVVVVATEGAGTFIDVELEDTVPSHKGFTEDKIVDKTFYLNQYYSEINKENKLNSITFNLDYSFLSKWYKAPLDATSWTQDWESTESWRIDDNGSLITREEHNITVHTWSSEDTNGSWYRCDLTEKYNLLNEYDDRYEINASHSIYNCTEIDDPTVNSSSAVLNINLSDSSKNRVAKTNIPFNVTETSDANEPFSCMCDWITAMDFNQPQPFTKDELREQGYDDVTVNGTVEFRDDNGSLATPQNATVHIVYEYNNWHPALGFNALIDGSDFNQTEFVRTYQYSAGQMMEYQVYIDDNHNELFDEGEEMLCSQRVLFEDIGNFVCNTTDGGEEPPAIAQRELPLIIIRINFNDYQFRNDESVWHSKIFGNNEGELNHYYNEISYGNFQFKEANETDGTVNDGIITVSLNENHPGDVDSFIDRINSAASLANSYIDFSAYDKNHNGAISKDELQIMYLVAGGESATGVTPGVWAHAWCMYGGNAEAPTHDGVKIMNCGDNGGYSRFGERHFGIDGPDASMGIIAHELGHAALSLPDLYDYDGSSEGIGNFGLMGGGSWGKKPGDNYPGETPVHMTGWSKIKSGFAVPEVINSDVTNLNIRGASYSDYKFYKIYTGVADEYFLIENRAPSGYDMGLTSLAGTDSFTGGLSILHIDDTRQNNSDDAHRIVDIEEANNAGLDSKADRGHINNLFFSGNSDSFTPTSTPNSNTNDGTNTGISVTNISDAGSTMSVDIDVN